MLNDHSVHATIATTDLGKTRPFYEETLGLKTEMEGPDGVFYRSGDTRLFLYPSQFAGTAKSTVASWEVDDLEAVIADLSSRGVTFEQYDLPGLKTDERGIAATDDFRGVWFKDPDGNILSVSEVTRK